MTAIKSIIWNWACNPVGFHVWRWRLLAIWIVAFSLITAYTINRVRDESVTNDKRFCAVTKAFIGIQIDIQSELNRQGIIELGGNQEIVRATTGQLTSIKVVLKNMPTQPTIYYLALRKFLRATKFYLETSRELSVSRNQSSRRLLAQRAASIAEAKKLRENLQCVED